jgi:ArsR family transcriptional regulator, arsenate/arsenite/antimonite-responsive transcriptional repressor
MREVMDMLKALADENRVRLLFALKSGELCVCQLIALMDLAPSTVSKHLSILRSARLVDSRKDGRWMYYSLPKKFRSTSTGRVLDLLFKEIENTDQIAKDRKHLQIVCSEDMEKLCRRLFCKS